MIIKSVICIIIASAINSLFELSLFKIIKLLLFFFFIIYDTIKINYIINDYKYVFNYYKYTLYLSYTL